MTAEKARFGDHFTVTSGVLDSASSFSAKRNFDHNELTTMRDNSPASLDNGFKYIGNGYFYSPYEASTTETFLKAVGMALEGSLLDFQIADVVDRLFDGCHTGDVRVHFDAVWAPEHIGAAAIGKLVNKNVVGVYKTTRGFNIGLYSEDAKTSTTVMFKRLIDSARFTLLMTQLFAFVWSIFVTYNYPLNSPSAAVSGEPNSKAAKIKTSRIAMTDLSVWAAEAIGLTAMVIGAANFAMTGSVREGLGILCCGAGIYWISRVLATPAKPVSHAKDKNN